MAVVLDRVYPVGTGGRPGGERRNAEVDKAVGTHAAHKQEAPPQSAVLAIDGVASRCETFTPLAVRRRAFLQRQTYWFAVCKPSELAAMTTARNSPAAIRAYSREAAPDLSIANLFASSSMATSYRCSAPPREMRNASLLKNC
jgi:hypothetical protein